MINSAHSLMFPKGLIAPQLTSNLWVQLKILKSLILLIIYSFSFEQMQDPDWKPTFVICSDPLLPENLQHDWHYGLFSDEHHPIHLQHGGQLCVHHRPVPLLSSSSLEEMEKVKKIIASRSSPGVIQISSNNPHFYHFSGIDHSNLTKDPKLLRI